MDETTPSSPAHNQSKAHDAQKDERQQATPPGAFPFPAGAQPVLNQPGYPMQAHVLVDPVTGQHYIVPQAYYPPMQPMQPMQPMYYPPAQTAQHPMYYPYPKQPGLPAPSQMYMGMPMYNNMTPTSSVANGAPGHSNNRVDASPRYGAQEEKAENSEDAMSTTSNFSRNSINSMTRQNPMHLNRENSREYMFRNAQQEYDYPLRSPVGRGKFDLPFSRLQRIEAEPHLSTQSDFEGRSPRQHVERMAASSASDVESAKRISRNLEEMVSIPSPNSPRNTPEQEKKPVEKRANPTSKSIRMEINFDEVPTLPQDKKPARKSTSTAFTVNLGEEEKDLSLQEAARNLEIRRKKISGKSSDAEMSSPLPNSKTNKNYLLERLLTGKNSNSPNTDVVSNSNDYEAEGSEVGSSSYFDAKSEALTFVVDTSKRPTPAYYSQAQYQTKVVQYSDDDDDSSSDSEITQQYESKLKVEAPPPSSTPCRPNVLPSPSTKPSTPSITKPSPSLVKPSAVSPRVPSSFERSTGSKNSDFLQELAKLRVMAGLPASGPTGSDSETTRSPFRRSETSSARAPTVSSTQKVVQNRSSFNSRTREPQNKVTTPTAGRKIEARRSITGSSSPQLSNLSRPPFRSGNNRGIMIGTSEQQREQEMTAWLRRKGYNPMNAAAAAKKTSDPRSREQQFTSRRSMTFHSTNEQPIMKQTVTASGRAVRNRSQEPRDLGDEKYRRGGRPGEQKISGLSKAINMLSEKCKKSIELIRIQNKGCLSVSVEDLLSAAAEEPRPNESLDEQLDRLSNAFDAVQRYLEQYSLDGYNSPVPESFYEDDTVESRSTFSGVSTHKDSDSLSSYRRKVLDS